MKWRNVGGSPAGSVVREAVTAVSVMARSVDRRSGGDGASLLSGQVMRQ